MKRGGTNRTKPFPLPLSSNADQSAIEVEIGEIKLHALTHAQASAIKGLKHRPIAEAEGVIGGDGVEQSDDLVDAEELGKSLRLPGIPQSHGRVEGESVESSKVAEERSKAGEAAGHGCGGVAPSGKPGGIASHQRRVDRGRIDVSPASLLNEFEE
jgi:hypothetical protein